MKLLAEMLPEIAKAFLPISLAFKSQRYKLRKSLEHHHAFCWLSDHWWA
jgi:hypothetical protein